MTIKEILNSNDPIALKALFAFNSTDSNEKVLVKFNLWSRKFFPKYFSSPDAPFHKASDLHTLQVYRGELTTFVDIAFRGAAKTARKKLFRAFVILNDTEHRRKYLKVASEDIDNAKQIVTDVYNMLIQPQIRALWPETFEKTDAKREERMDSFTTATGIKLVAVSVGVSQRGAIQDEARPDEMWFEDFESRTTLRSARKTKSIWENMEEARTGLAKGGGAVYTCNYVSEQGNVHQLVVKEGMRKVVRIQSIINEDGTPAWSRYSKEDIDQMRVEDEDFEGERLCKPSASRDVLFDRESLDRQVAVLPVRESAGFKMFRKYDPSHRYGSGHDTAGGVGLDSCTSVFMDFSVIPAQVVGTFKNDSIRPDVFGDEIAREGDFFGMPLAGIEKNNHGHATIARARQLGVNLYQTQKKDDKIDTVPSPTEYGWHTNALTKPKMLFAFAKACEDGLVDLNDPDLIQEAKSYTRNDLIDDEKDPRLTTRHFDLLVAGCIAWQMKDHATVQEVKDEWIEEAEDILYPDIGM